MNECEPLDQTIETQRKLFLLGFMPHQEVAGLLLGELGEAMLDLERLHTCWRPKVAKANELRQTDQLILDDAAMEHAVRPLDPTFAAKAAEVEAELTTRPLWRMNSHTLAMVRLDDLIVLQGAVNIDRAEQLVRGIDASINNDQLIGRLIDYSCATRRISPPIYQRQIRDNAVMFSSHSHDIRPGNVEVRSLPRYTDGSSDQLVRALVVPILEGEPAVNCVRTFTMAQFPDGSVRRIWFLTLQITYKVSAPYDSSDERSIRWDDPALAIAWPVEVAPIVSVKDAAAPLLRDAELPEYVS